MHIRLIAVGGRQPVWVAAAFDDYAKRLPGQWRFQLETVAAGARSGNDKAEKARDLEGRRVLQRIKPADRAILLDERGAELSTAEFADRLTGWQTDGRDLSFIIGGPDGVSKRCSERADFRWSLSRLTLPHGFARILFIEQLYRAWTLATGHPYHRA